MSIPTRKELLAALRPMYARVSWKEKQQVLDGFVAATGYNRKHAIVLLNGKKLLKEGTRSRRSKYDEDVRDALIQVWKASNRICSKRLIPFLPTIISSLEKFGHLNISDTVKQKLFCLSQATADRLLQQERKKYARRKSTTKPGYLLKKHIPIRTFADWDNVVPGFFEADLVAHGGRSASGQFLHTLTMTDIASGWTECSSLLGKSEVSVLRAFTLVKAALPFPLLGLDTDNGSEFINHAVLKWCEEQAITFTRSREYKKNDQAHVEEKNGSVVRRLIGYDRFEGEESWRLLGALYEVSRLYVNFFQPSLKLLDKERDGGHVKRIYGKALTPCQRLLASENIPQKTKRTLERQFKSLDPLSLLTEMERLQIEFWSTAVKNEYDADRKVVAKFIKETKLATKNVAAPTRILNRPRRRRRDDWTPTASYAGRKKGKKTNLDAVWDEVCIALEANPWMVPREVLRLLDERHPGRFRHSQLSTITDKMRRWRHEHSMPTEFEKLQPGRKSNIDEVWLLALDILEVQPNMSNRGLHRTLMERFPDLAKPCHRTSIVNRLKTWRHEHAEKLDNVEKIDRLDLKITIFEEALNVVSKLPGTSKIVNEATRL